MSYKTLIHQIKRVAQNNEVILDIHDGINHIVTRVNKKKLSNSIEYFRNIFELLRNYQTNPRYSFKFPVSYESPDSELTLSLVTLDDAIKVDSFSLTPVTAPEVSKYVQVVNEQNKLITTLQSEIASLKTIIELLQSDKQPVTVDEREVSDEVCKSDCEHVPSDDSDEQGDNSTYMMCYK